MKKTSQRSAVNVICRFRPINKQETETWERNRILALLTKAGLQELYPKFKVYKNKKYQDPRKWQELVNDERKLRVDFKFTPNDRLKFQKLVAHSDFEDWDLDSRRKEENIGVEIDEQLNQISVEDDFRTGRTKFAFDKVMDWENDQEEAFEHIALGSGFLEDAMEGIDSTLLAYGQTGSGKTYTMFGSEPIAKCSEEDEGIVPRSFRWLFDQVEEDDDITDVKVYVEAVEVYLGKLRDLLEPNKGKKEKVLRIGEMPDEVGRRSSQMNRDRRKQKKKGKTFIKIGGAFEAVAQNLQDMKMLIARAWQNRTIEKTAANAVSSRSHMLLRTRVVITKQKGTKIQSRLTFGDLAGSEKTKHSNVRGRQMKQAQDINNQLFVLRQCVEAVVSGKNKRIPYGDALLTKVLQHSLSGKTRLSFVTTCSPHRSNLAETLGTCDFAHQCRQLEVQVTRNVVDTREALEQKLRRAVERIEELERRSPSCSVQPEEVEALRSMLASKNDMVERMEKELSNTEEKLRSVSHRSERMEKELSVTEEKLRSTEEKLRSVSYRSESNYGSNYGSELALGLAHTRDRSRRGSMDDSSWTEELTQTKTENEQLRKLLKDTMIVAESQNTMVDKLQAELRKTNSTKKLNDRAVNAESGSDLQITINKAEFSDLQEQIQALRRSNRALSMEKAALKKSNVSLKKKVVRLHGGALKARSRSKSPLPGSERSESGSSEAQLASTVEQQQDLLRGMAKLLCQQAGTTGVREDRFKDIAYVKSFLSNVSKELELRELRRQNEDAISSLVSFDVLGEVYE